MPNEEMVQTGLVATVTNPSEEEASEEPQQEVEEGQNSEEQTAEVEEQETQEQTPEPEKKKRRNRTEERFSKLTASLKSQEDLINQLRAENTQIRSQYDSLNNQVSKRQSSNGTKGWDDLTSEELQTVIASDNSQYDGATRARATRELMRREAKSQFDELKGATTLRDKQLGSFHAVAAEIQAANLGDSDFDLTSQNSKLMQNANQIFSQYQNEDWFKTNPQNQGIALREAYSRLMSEKFLELSGKNKSLSKKAGKNAKAAQLESEGKVMAPDSSNRKSLEQAVTGAKSWRDVIGERISHKIPRPT